MVYLSRKQEELIADLESYTAALQERAKNIEKSDKKCGASNVKRKREVWKTRNNSGQVAAALNLRTSRKTSNDSDLSSGNMSLIMKAARQAAEAMVQSPAKRAKKTIPDRKKTITSRSPPKASRATGVLPPKAICDCYCQTLNTSSKRKRIACKFGKNCPLRNNSSRQCKDLSMSVLESQRKTLEEARSVISYSPESVFLQRLKTKSQINLNAVEDDCSGKRFTLLPIRGNGHINKDSQEDSSQSVTDSPKECLHRKPSSLKKNEQKAATKKSTKFNSRKESNPSPSLNGKQANGGKKTSPTSRKTRSSMRHKTIAECSCHQREPEMVGYDIVAGLVDNAKQSKELNGSGDEKDDLVDKVSEFRRTHWFDCHATHDHPKNVANSKTLDRKIAPDGHECFHRYILNDRLFPTPLYADSQNRSRCMKCHLPEDAATSEPQEAVVRPARPRGAIEISLPKRILPKTVDEKPSVAGFKVSGNVKEPTKAVRMPRPCPLLHPSGCAAKRVPSKPPVPTNSLALRYQKGIV